MIFSQADFDLLRLLRWNRHLLPETIDGLFTERDIQNLIALGLIKIHQRSGSFVLTSKGNQLLNDTLSIAAPDTPPSYRPVEMQRRLRLSMLAVTAYRAHIHIFTTGPEELSSSPSLFLRQSPAAGGITRGVIPGLRRWPIWAGCYSMFTMSVPASGSSVLLTN